MSWDDAYIQVKGKTQPDDSLDLRNSFIEGILRDEWGNEVKQAQLHKELQQFWYESDLSRTRSSNAEAPYGSGKSQQLIGTGLYHSTRTPEESALIITAAPDLAKKRIITIRDLVESDNYQYWCKFHHFQPLQYDKKDTDASDRIYFKSMNKTGNPSFEAHGVDTGGTGMRCWRLYGDDICDMKDFNSTAIRNQRLKSWTNTWTKRKIQGGFIYMIGTPYHPQDANQQIRKTGTYNTLSIAVREDKTGYDVEKVILEEE